MQIRRWLWASVAAGLIASVAMADDHGEKKDKDAKDAKEAKPAAAAVGKPAPDFELKDLDGKVHKLSDYKDKVVVLEWFNLQCPFVVAAAKQMSETSAKYAKEGVVWLAIDSTHPEHGDYRDATVIKEHFAKHGIAYPLLRDGDGKIGRAYGARTTPHMYIINKGTLVYIGGHDDGTGVQTGDRNYVAESLDAVLAGKEVPSATTRNRGCSIKYRP